MLLLLLLLLSCAAYTHTRARRLVKESVQDALAVAHKEAEDRRKAEAQRLHRTAEEADQRAQALQAQVSAWCV